MPSGNRHQRFCSVCCYHAGKAATSEPFGCAAFPPTVPNVFLRA